MPNTAAVCAPDALTEELNYTWLQPGKPVKPQAEAPFWLYPNQDDITEVVEDIVEQQWRVDFIRRQITRLGVKPKGQRRVDLVRQLIECFLDPDRVARQWATLDAEEQRYYLYWLLYNNLSSLRTQPTFIDQIATFSKPIGTLTQRILQAGLGLQNEEGQSFVPFEMFKLFPPVYLPFDSEPPPARFTPAADPHLLLTHVQQLLGLVQAGDSHIQPRPRWSPPRVSYYSAEYQIHPPVPDDARRLLSNPNLQGVITLCPPIPYLADQTLAAWSAHLELSPSIAELLYHVLLSGQLLLPGDPVTLDMTLFQSWMIQTSYNQWTALYQLYRHIADWADWWPDWRTGEIKIQWNYQYAWGLSAIDNTLHMTHVMLRWTMLDLLAFLPHDTWLSLDKVIQFLIKLYPEPKTYHYQQSLLCKDAQDQWKGFLERVLCAMLKGALHAFGLVDIAPTPDEIEVFRLRHLQDLHWNRPGTLLIEDTTAFSRDDVAFSPHEQMLSIKPPAKAEFLSAIQQWSKPGGLVDSQLCYQLDVERLHQAFEQGETPDTLAERWEKSSTFPPFPEIQQWWQHWWERYGHVRFYPQQVTLMTRDEFTLHELQVALPTVRDAILGLVTPQVALLQPEQVSHIVSDLKRQGYMPKEET
ncbi:MAG TPA: hypothetical protein PLH19_08735 [Anaerolineae bacterium]|nr:hypothetical protein [Anaerolineae bacterium]HQH38602.1 hypothetical protein [Anaerolineae bacterium]